jgi:hypothetical protein
MDGAANDDRAALAEAEIAEIEELRKRIRALGNDVPRLRGRLHARLRQHPLIALGAALAAGFLVGRLIRRATESGVEARRAATPWPRPPV